MTSRAVALGMLAMVINVGCAGRYIRMDEKGLTCAEAYQIAIAAVRRMNYAIDTSTKPTPGAPGVITATLTEGTSTRGLLVQVFCTTLGAAVEAKTDQGGLAEINFPSEFKRSFEAAAANRAPQRQASATGLDVLLTPERGNSAALGVDVSALGILPVSVRISNHTDRTYAFRPTRVVLSTAEGERTKPLAVGAVTQLSAADADTLRAKVLGERDIQPGETITGFLLFPFKAYARARVVLIDRASAEPEGFSIEF